MHSHAIALAYSKPVDSCTHCNHTKSMLNNSFQAINQNSRNKVLIMPV